MVRAPARKQAHYYRINALVGPDWITIDGGMFETPDCYVVQRLTCDPVANSRPSFTATFRVPYPGILEHGAPMETWLDLSTLPNEFAEGTFVGAGPFSVKSTSPSDVPGGTITFNW